MTDRPPNGPGLWTAILDHMPAGAVVAGGAVRDFLLDVEPKDIDVFMGHPPLTEYAPAPASAGGIFADNLEIVVSSDPRPRGLYRIDNQWERQEEYAALSNIDLVSSGTLLGWRVDAVVVTNFTDGDALIDTFDFGLTRSWFCAERGLFESAAAFDDRIYRRVSLMLDERRERAEVRFARFNKRMGGTFTLVDRTI